MKAEDVGEWTTVALFLSWLLGIPIAFGYLLAFLVNPLFVIVGAFFWPVVGLGWFGYWLAT